MVQTGLFDWQQRFEELNNGGDPLVKLNTLVDWETFRPALETLRQKDVEARWTKKNGRTPYGDSNHIAIDAKHKLIRNYALTSAAVHDSQVFEGLLDPQNSSRDVWADSAYRSQEKLAALSEGGFREHLQRQGCRHRTLTEREKRGRHTRSKIRSRIEHVFGVQTQRAGTLILRSIGRIRAQAKRGLRNLAYTLDRYAMLKITSRSSTA